MVVLMDPIADFINRLKNAGQARQESVSVSASKHVRAIADVLKAEGYIGEISEEKRGSHSYFKINLMYRADKSPKIRGVKRISKPSRRLYAPAREIPNVKYGHGHLLVSTPQGIKTDSAARQEKLGGELLFKIW